MISITIPDIISCKGCLSFPRSQTKITEKKCSKRDEKKTLKIFMYQFYIHRLDQSIPTFMHRKNRSSYGQ